LESVTAGVPVVAWPLCFDQRLNARRLVKLSMAVMVSGTGLIPDRLVPAEEIASTLQTIAWSDPRYKEAAGTLKTKIETAIYTSGGSSATACQNLIQHIANIS
jgi:UDP:flavonoid glycosyltransferase YjiC (YdhE family)